MRKKSPFQPEGGLPYRCRIHPKTPFLNINCSNKVDIVRSQHYR